MQAGKQETKKNTSPAAPAGVKTAASAVKPASASAKPKKPVSGGAVLAVMLIMLIIAAVALVYLDVGGIRGKLVDALQTEDTGAADETAAVDADQLEAKQAELDEQAQKLDEQSASLKKKSQELKDKEKALSDQEEELTTRENAVADTENSIQQSQQSQSDLETTAAIFEQMEAAVAATAISGLDTVDDMVALLRVMPSDKAAAIIGNMEESLATKVLSAMMK